MNNDRKRMACHVHIRTTAPIIGR